MAGSSDRRIAGSPYLLVIGSGCAALIYEVVWFQVLQLVIGASAASLAVLLGTFMGGMFAGSLLLARYVSPARHPLKVFAAIEAAIGAWGALLIVVMPLVGRLYTAVDGGGPSSIVLRALASGVLLLPPTILMGATLPAISRSVEAVGLTRPALHRMPGPTDVRIARVSLFYGANILGAVIGCLCAGFYLLRWFDLASASLVAVLLNAIVASTALLLARRAPHVADLSSHHEIPTSQERRTALAGPPAVYVAIALSGFTALGAEVIWTRLLSLLFGATTYTFSLILSAFLAGLGSGSVLGAALVRRVANARALLGWAQFGVSFGIAYGAWMAEQYLPSWSIDTSLAPVAALNFQTDLYRALLAVLPGTMLWGLSVPLAIAAVGGSATDVAAAVGRVYAANTFGAIAGAVLTALVFIPAGGTQGAQRLLIVVSAVSAGVALLPVITVARTLSGPRGLLRAGSNLRTILALRPAPVFLVVSLTTGAGVAAASVSPVPAGLVAWGRLLPWHGEPSALYVGEGVNASIAVTEESNGWRNFHVSGKVEASTEPQDMRLQRLLGHLTALMHEQGPKQVLVVGFGAGVTAGALSIHPSVERLVICELEPLIPNVVAKYFGDTNYDVATDLKVRIVYDDARHYVLTTHDRFDVITSDPVHPWVKGAATLYTREYFENVRDHLNPGGVVTQWVPLYESTEKSVRSVIATFLQVFPHGSVWRNDDTSGRGYDAVLVGRTDETPIDLDAWQARIDRPEYQKVRDSLAEVGYGSAVDLLATYLGRGQDLGPWVAGAKINTDRNLRLQYLAGAGVNNNIGTEIRDSMLHYRRFPGDLFAGDPATVARLRERLQAPATQ
jgi:spermidine synthase